MFTFLTCLFSTNVATSQDKWIRFEPLDIPISVVVPGVPKYEFKEIITSIGSLVNDSYTLEMEKDHPNFLYLINKVEYPKGFLEDDDEFLEEFLTEAVASTSEATKCDPVYVSNSIISGVKCKLYRLMDKKKTMVVKGKLFVYQDQLISIQVFSLVDKSMNKLIDQFLDSASLKTGMN